MIGARRYLNPIQTSTSPTFAHIVITQSYWTLADMLLGLWTCHIIRVSACLRVSCLAAACLPCLSVIKPACLPDRPLACVCTCTSNCKLACLTSCLPSRPVCVSACVHACVPACLHAYCDTLLAQHGCVLACVSETLSVGVLANLPTCLRACVCASYQSV